MANLILDQDVTIKRKSITTHTVANYFMHQAAWILRYGSLMNINPSAIYHVAWLQ